MRISVLGVGALGSVVAASLANTEHEVHLHVRGERGAHLMVEGLHIQGHGLEMVDADRFLITCEEFEVPEGFHEASDLVILACKSHALPHLVHIAKRFLREDGCAFALTNGLGHTEALARSLGPQRVLAATTTHGAFIHSSGEVEWAGKGELNLASTPLGPGEMMLHRIQEVLTAGGLNPIVHSDASAMVWSKLLLNIAINPIAALAGLQNGELLSPDVLSTCLMVYREAAQVASMERVSIPNEMEFETRLRQVLETTSDNTCSMLQDIKAGRRTEIDALNQAVANLGEEHGLRMPLNHLLAVLVQACHP